jgi:hypothetical protein
MKMTSEVLERPFSSTQVPSPGTQCPSSAQDPDGPQKDVASVEMLRRLRYELDLFGTGGRRRVRERLHHWLSLPAEDASNCVAAYNRARELLTPIEQQDLDEMERDVVRHGIRYDEFQRLADFGLQVCGDEIPRPQVAASGNHIPPPVVVLTALATP